MIKINIPITAVVLGGDISRYQASADGTKRFDFDKFLVAGGKFIIIRAGVGANGEDYQFRYNLQEAQARGIPVFLYHVLKVEKNWGAQIYNFNTLSLGMDGKPVGVGEFLDFETNDDNLDKPTCTSRYFKVSDGMRDGIEGVPGLGRDPMAYSAPAFMDANTYNNDRWKTLDWFIANYNYSIDDYDSPPPQSVDPWLPDVIGKISNPKLPIFWQFTNRGSGFEFGSGGDDDIDLDWYLGTPAEFETRFNCKLPVGTIPPPPPSEYPKQVVVKASPYLNYRTSPWGKDLGDIYSPSLLTVIGQDGDWLHLADGWVHKDYVRDV